MTKVEYEHLTERYRLADRDCADLFYRLSSRKTYERTLFVPNIADRPSWESRLNALRAGAAALPAPEPQFDVVKGHLEDFLAASGWKLTALYEDPCEALNPFLWTYDGMDQDHRSQEEQNKLLIEIYAQLPAVWEGIRGWYRQVNTTRLRGTIAALTEAQAGIVRMEFADPELSQVMELTAQRFGTYAEELKQLLTDGGEDSAPLPDSERTIRMPEEEYRALLRDHRGVDLDELLSWGTAEMEKTRRNCFAIAEKLADDKGEPRPQTMAQVNDLLFRYAGPCNSPEEMFERASGYLKRARALAYEYVRMPKEEYCRLAETPWKLRDSFPWGGYSDGDIEGRPISGQMFLNQYNYKAVTDGWLRMNCLHEAYPGHHVQFVRTITDPIPETMKIGAKSIPLMEGMCHRTEHAFEFIYGEDPFYPLFVAYRRHHTAVRIQVDLMLYYYGRPIEEAVRLYEKELGFDRRTARGQVQAHENMPGYFTCYYYGMKKICDWEEQYGFEKKAYTELLFSLSNVSLETFEKVLKLTEEQREHFFHDFASLYMDPHETFF